MPKLDGEWARCQADVQLGYLLADGGVSACQGADTNGPTATVNSAGKIDQVPIYVPLFNMKFHPSAVATKEDLLKFLALMQTYFDDYGGKHMQFNVVSKETLRESPSTSGGKS